VHVHGLAAAAALVVGVRGFSVQLQRVAAVYAALACICKRGMRCCCHVVKRATAHQQ
jgi:hypothetical protein